MFKFGLILVEIAAGVFLIKRWVERCRRAERCSPGQAPLSTSRSLDLNEFAKCKNEGHL